MTNVRELHQSNRAAWNEAAVRYADDLERMIAFLRDGGANFEPPEYWFLTDLDSWCGRAIHLQCAGGTDTLSLWNLGAREVVGIDISEEMISVARRKSAALNAPAHWHCCDVLDTPQELDGTADLVYTGRGALCWLLDMEGWASVVARLLKPGGLFYLFEGHPIAWIWDSTKSNLQLDPIYGDYFDRTVQAEQGWGPTYIGELEIPKERLTRKYESQKTFGDILNPLARAGLLFERIEEHPEEFWEPFPEMPTELKSKLPNTFSLAMRKPE